MNNWKSTDGYLLFDFSDVNPALTNQTVDGIYQRAKNLIANNKFVLLVNEGVHTPIPAVVAFVNQAYVIETVLYAYTITSNDNVKKTNHEYGAATLEDMTDVSLLNPTDGQYLGYDAETNYWVNKSIPTIPTKTSDLTNDSGFVTSAAIPTKTSDLTNDSGFITDADVPVIDDTTTSATKVWSSDKVSSELSGKADSSSIPTKTSQLSNDSGFITSADVPVIDDTAVVNNKVWSSYKTNSELLGKQNTLTAGSNISISGDTISATDTTYSEGDGIDITSGVISMDIDSLTAASSVAGTDLIAISDTDGAIKSTTAAAVAGLAWDYTTPTVTIPITHRGDIICYKMGKLVIVNVNINTDSNTTPIDGTICSGLPKPINDFYPRFTARNANGSQVQVVHLLANGSITVSDYVMSGATWWGANIVYMTND